MDIRVVVTVSIIILLSMSYTIYYQANMGKRDFIMMQTGIHLHWTQVGGIDVNVNTTSIDGNNIVIKFDD